MTARTVFLWLLASAIAFGVSTSVTAEPQVERIVCRPSQTIADFVNPRDLYTQNDLDPGPWPEGDLMGWAAFTADGSRVLLTNRGTANLTVFNVATMQSETTFDVGSHPAGIAVTDSFAIIARSFADSVTIVRLSDWSIAARLASGVQPWVVRTSPDQTWAYVACDISNTCEVYDLTTLTHVATLTEFPFFLSTYSWNSENGRWTATFSDFAVTPDGSHLLACDGIDTLFWIDAATGAKDDTLAGIGGCRAVSLSGNGTRAVVTNGANPCVAYQVDIASHAVTGTVTLTGYSQSMSYNAAVNPDGSKAYIGTSNNTSTLIRFATSDFITFTQTYTAFWVGVSPDHARAISGNNRFSIIDFASETMTGQHQGNSQSNGAVSPVGTSVVAFDAHRHEGLYFYDYANPTPIYRGTTPAGTPPEADCPHRVAITPDGAKAVCTNVLSDNVTIIDLGSNSVAATLPVGDRPYDIAITSDSRWAVVCGMEPSQVYVLDLAASTIATAVSAGSGAMTACIGPGDTLAYVGNVVSNTISVIRLAGASSYKVTDIPCGEIGIVWAAYGVPSGIAASPNGRYSVVAVSFEDAVRVIDNSTNTVVDTLTVGDFPLSFAFDSTGSYATVTNYLGNSISVLYIDGSSSSVVGTFSYGNGPLRLAYNPVRDEIGIVNYAARTLTNVNPRTGALSSTVSYTAWGFPLDVSFDENGDPIVLTASDDEYGYLSRGDDHAALPGPPTKLDHCPALLKTAVAMPGPDYVSIFDWSAQATTDRHPTRSSSHSFTLTPNPCRSSSLLHLTTGPLDRSTTLRLFSSSGRLLRALDTRYSTFDVSDLPAGLYFVRLTSGVQSTAVPLTIVR